MKILLVLVALSFLLILPAAASQDNSSAQISGILNQVEDRLLAQRQVYWNIGDYPRIIALDRIVTAGDPHELECFQTGGWLLDSLGHRKQALVYYRQGVANNPNTEDLYFYLAFFYFNSMHEYRHAANAFKLATEQSDAGINDWKMLAHSYTQAHEYNRAVATWEIIKKRWPHGLAVQQNLDEALAMQMKARSGNASQ